MVGTITLAGSGLSGPDAGGNYSINEPAEPSTITITVNDSAASTAFPSGADGGQTGGITISDYAWTSSSPSTSPSCKGW